MYIHVERFSLECHKTKTKVIMLANQNRERIQLTNQNSNQIHVTGAKRRKTRAGKSRLVLVLLLIGRENSLRKQPPAKHARR